jgi:uncharacterized protein involved in exopolysaccharide biosynthesis
VRRYIQTFSRHKIALILPVVIAVAFSTWYVRSAPKTYQTWMNLWFDTATPSVSSLEQLPSGQTPAAQGQAQLQEFLSTSQFLVNVGHRGPLAADLARTGTTSQSDIDLKIGSTLLKAFTVTTTGPQVVQVSMTGHNPTYMAGTLKAVADEYVAEVSSTLQARSTETVSYFQTQVQAASSALQKANAAVVAYQQGHPDATPTSDPRYAQLTESAFQAQTNLTTQQTNLQQAELPIGNVQTPVTFHVIDPPKSPVVKSTKKHEILISAAGLMAGLVISILALSALTSLDKTLRNEEDIDEMLGVEVVASIRSLPRERTFALGRAKAR